MDTDAFRSYYFNFMSASWVISCWYLTPLVSSHLQNLPVLIFSPQQFGLFRKRLLQMTVSPFPSLYVLVRSGSMRQLRSADPSGTGSATMVYQVPQRFWSCGMIRNYCPWPSGLLINYSVKSVSRTFSKAEPYSFVSTTVEKILISTEIDYM